MEFELTRLHNHNKEGRMSRFALGNLNPQLIAVN